MSSSSWRGPLRRASLHIARDARSSNSGRTDGNERSRGFVEWRDVTAAGDQGPTRGFTRGGLLHARVSCRIVNNPLVPTVSSLADGRPAISWRSSSVAVSVLVIAAVACTSGGVSEESASDALRAYCGAVDVAGLALGEVQREFDHAKGDPQAPAANLASVFADQVDDAASELSLQDEWTVVVTNRTNTQLWREDPCRLERDPQDRSSWSHFLFSWDRLEAHVIRGGNFDQIPNGG